MCFDYDIRTLEVKSGTTTTKNQEPISSPATELTTWICQNEKRMWIFFCRVIVQVNIYEQAYLHETRKSMAIAFEPTNAHNSLPHYCFTVCASNLYYTREVTCHVIIVSSWAFVMSKYWYWSLKLFNLYIEGGKFEFTPKENRNDNIAQLNNQTGDCVPVCFGSSQYNLCMHKCISAHATIVCKKIY